MATKRKPAPKKPPKKKEDPLLTQAKKFGASKYAPSLDMVKRQRTNNLSSYNLASSQRTNAANAEMGSIEAADNATQQFLAKLKESSGNVYQQAMEKSQKANLELQGNRQNANTALLSRMQADAANRGLTSSDTTELSTQLTAKSDLLSGLGEINRGSIERMGLISQGSLDNSSISTRMIAGTAKSSARGDAQRALDELYSTYSSERSKLEGEESKLNLEKQDYINQLYGTLKDKAKAEKAARDQAALQARIASGNLNFKKEQFKVNTQYKYDKLASDNAIKSMAQKLQAEGFSHRKAMDLAKLALQKSGSDLQWQKFNWSKANPAASASANIADLIASLK